MSERGHATHGEGIMNEITIGYANSLQRESLTQCIQRHLIEHNVSSSDIASEEDIVVSATKPDGEVIGGVSATLWGACLEIKFIWVSDHERGHRIGSRLMQELERTSRSKGCRRVLVDTYSFQAPSFYINQGYRECFRVDGYSTGNISKIFFMKELE